MNYEDTAEKEVLYSKFSMIPSITAKAILKYIDHRKCRKYFNIWFQKVFFQLQ